MELRDRKQGRDPLSLISRRGFIKGAASIAGAGSVHAFSTTRPESSSTWWDHFGLCRHLHQPWRGYLLVRGESFHGSLNSNQSLQWYL